MNVRDFYDKIAGSWYNVRHWGIAEEELKKINKRWIGGKILNIGCAHGPDFLPFDSTKFQFFGVDISKELLKLARKYSEKFNMIFYLALADMKFLPFKDSSFDYVISVATIHHLLNKEQRIQTLKEIKRVLKKEAFISIWNRENPKLPNQKVIERKWTHENKILKRKYYLYTREEFRKELEESGFKILELKTGKGKKNIFAIIRPTEHPS